MPTIQERRHQELIAQLDRALGYRDDAIAKLVRYETKVLAFRRQVARYARMLAQPKEPQTPKPPSPKREVTNVTNIPVSECPVADSLDVPDFLRRTKGDADRVDAETAAAIRSDQDARKQTKSRVRIEKMKAVKRGDTKRMPLSGRAALDAIRQG